MDVNIKNYIIIRISSIMESRKDSMREIED
jgi:hypothetical protein